MVSVVFSTLFAWVFDMSDQIITCRFYCVTILVFLGRYGGIHLVPKGPLIGSRIIIRFSNKVPRKRKAKMGKMAKAYLAQTRC